MGLFSRRDKSSSKPSLRAISNGSVYSGNSSLKSPPPCMTTTTKRASDGSATPLTPLTPFSPLLAPFSPSPIPKVDLPRPPDPQLDPAGYLRSLGAVRDRSRIVTEKALRNELRHFDVDMTKFSDVVSFVSNIIKVSAQYPGRPL